MPSSSNLTSMFPSTSPTSKSNLPLVFFFLSSSLFLCFFFLCSLFLLYFFLIFAFPRFRIFASFDSDIHFIIFIYYYYNNIIGYMPIAFNTFFTISLSTGQLTQTDGGPGETPDPVIISTSDGSAAMGSFLQAASFTHYPLFFLSSSFSSHFHLFFISFPIFFVFIPFSSLGLFIAQ